MAPCATGKETLQKETLLLPRKIVFANISFQSRSPTSIEKCRPMKTKSLRIATLSALSLFAASIFAHELSYEHTHPQWEYRGQLSSNEYHPDSTANEYGRYGSPYSPDSINNPYRVPRSPNGPMLQSKDGRFLGRLNDNPYDPDSVSNPYGRYGSEYSPDSINNPYGRYGSKYSNESPTNPYATEAPRLFED